MTFFSIFKTKWLFCVVIIFSIAIFLMYLTPKSHIEVGFYDPGLKLNSLQGIRYTHLFINWQKELPADFISAFKKIPTEVTPIVSVEPWPKDNKVNYLNEVEQGKYDDYIEPLCSLFKEKAKVIVRFGHEMERKGSRYPWANDITENYINAYNYFAKYCKKIAPNTLYMFSPAGESSSINYWPGEKNVDIIGFSVYSFDEWEVKNVGHRQTFSDIFKPKYDLFKKFNKDIFAVEVGVTGSSDFQLKWIENALNSKREFPLLKSLIYFESEDTPGSWGAEYKTPDWNIEIANIKKLLDN